MPTGRSKSDNATRPKLSLPGRLKATRREQHVLFWHLIAERISSEEAAVQVGASARLLVAVSLERPEVCHHHNILNHHHLYPGGICSFLSERRLRCTARKEFERVPLLAKLGGRHLQSRQWPLCSPSEFPILNVHVLRPI